MANKHMTRFSTSLTIKGMETRPMMRNHFPVTEDVKLRLESKDQSLTSVDEECKKLGPSQLACGNVKQGSHLGDQFGGSSQCETQNYDMVHNSSPTCVLKRTDNVQPHK